MSAISDVRQRRTGFSNATVFVREHFLVVDLFERERRVALDRPDLRRIPEPAAFVG